MNRAIFVLVAVYSRGMLWVGGGLEGKKGGLADIPTSSGKEGGRGHIWHISGPFQSGSRCILLPRDLAELPDGRWSSEEKRGEKSHSSFYWCCDVEYTYLGGAKA